MNSRRRIPFTAIAAALLLLCLVGGALLWRSQAPAAAAPDSARLAGADLGGAFALVDQDGRPTTDRDFAGRWRLMYFGYSFCPDVCPTDVQRMAQGYRAFEAAAPTLAAKVAPIFVTIDPARDTPAAVKQFVGAFHPKLTGLTGTPEQVKAAMSAYRVYGSKRGEGPDYLMDHSNMIYLFGPDGTPISFVAGDEPAAAVTAMLRDGVT